MLPRVIFVAIAVLCLTVATRGQADTTLEDCRRDLAVMTENPGVEITLAEPGLLDGRCEMRGVDLAWENLNVTIDRVSWVIVPADAGQPGGAARRFSLDLDGLYHAPSVGIPWFDFASAMQARQTEGISARLQGRMEGLAAVVDVLEIDFPGENRVAASVRLAPEMIETDIGSRTLWPNTLETYIIESFSLNIQTNGLFETYLWFVLADAVLGGSDQPAADWAEFQRMAGLAAMAMPEEIFPDPSREAMAEFIADLPNPTGWLHIDLREGTTLPLIQFTYDYNTFMGGLGQIPVALEGAVFDIRYRPTRP